MTTTTATMTVAEYFASNEFRAALTKSNDWAELLKSAIRASAQQSHQYRQALANACKYVHLYQRDNAERRFNAMMSLGDARLNIVVAFARDIHDVDEWNTDQLELSTAKKVVDALLRVLTHSARWIKTTTVAAALDDDLQACGRMAAKLELLATRFNDERLRLTSNLRAVRQHAAMTDDTVLMQRIDEVVALKMAIVRRLDSDVTNDFAALCKQLVIGLCTLNLWSLRPGLGKWRVKTEFDRNLSCQVVASDRPGFIDVIGTQKSLYVYGIVHSESILGKIFLDLHNHREFGDGVCLDDYDVSTADMIVYLGLRIPSWLLAAGEHA